MSHTFKEKFKSLLEREGLLHDQRGAEKKLGIPQPTISRYLRGENEPTLKTIIKISKHSNFPLSDFIDEKNLDISEVKGKEIAFKDRFKSILEELGLLYDQKGAEKRFGIPQSMISRYLRGENVPNMTTIKKMSEVSEIPMTAFLFGEKTGESPIGSSICADRLNTDKERPKMIPRFHNAESPDSWSKILETKKSEWRHSNYTRKKQIEAELLRVFPGLESEISEIIEWFDSEC